MPDIRKDPYADTITRNHETVGICGIVVFRKSGNTQSSNLYRHVRLKISDQALIDMYATVRERRGSDVYRKPVLLRNAGNSVNVIAMFVRYENCLYFSDAQANTLQAFFRFAAGDTAINQYSLVIIANVIRVSVAT